MKTMLPCMSLLLMLSSCDQLTTQGGIKNGTVHYDQLTAEKNYWDSIPGRVKVRDRNRPYRYYLNNDPYTGQVEDFYGPGKPKLSGAFKEGFAEGPWKYYQRNDSLEQSGSFENGYVTGEWRFYNRKGKEDTRLIYHAYHEKGQVVTADTLMVVYADGSRKEWQKDKVVCFYSNGKSKSEESPDGSSATFWDRDGKVIAEMNDYIKKNKVNGETTYYVAQGKHKKAYQELLDYKSNWTQEQKEAFKTANSVTLTAPGALSMKTYGYQVRVE